MTHIFEIVNELFAGVVPIADFLWDFPTNIDAYAQIPILGQLSLAIWLLLGGSLYFTIRFGFVQVKNFNTGIKLLTSKQEADVGTSQLAAFLISMGGRVGAGNIVGVTGAVTIGGPGAIFWMWISAFLFFFMQKVVPAMEALRKPVDELEMIVDKNMWPMPSYGDLLFEV